MKAVILAGGFGTRIQEETHRVPKPMVEIGGKPILWHILMTYSKFGINDFVICLGYKGYVIKEYFTNYLMHASDVTLDIQKGTVQYHSRDVQPWRVSLIDTGPRTMTGGRLKRVAPYLDDETFFMTYGDGVANIDINASLECHRASGRLATVTAVSPPGRFGLLELGDDSGVRSIREKPMASGSWINGGFFVLEPGVLDYIDDDSTSWERQPLERLAGDNQLAAYKHEGFWQPMDTLREKELLEQLWASGNAPWSVE